MRAVLAMLLGLHGLIHLLGFFEGLGIADIPELRGPYGEVEGLLWGAAAALLVGGAFALRLAPRLWWVPALAGVLLSQALIAGAWDDAAVGTAANVVLLVPIALAAADLRPSSLRSRYEADTRGARPAPAVAPRITADDLAPLPAPVRTWLERVGVVGAPGVLGFHAAFRARIRGGPDDRWMKGWAEQYERVDPPTRLFFMKATRAGLPVHVYHRYSGGSATMEGRLLGLFRIFRITGPELTRSETVTLLNDLVFLAPAALLDVPVEWESLDARRVRARFTNAGHTVSAVLHFDDAGDLVDFESADRFQMDRDPPTLARWSTPFYPHRDYDGRRLPSGGEARWGEAGDAWPYAVLDLRSIRYDVPGRPSR